MSGEEVWPHAAARAGLERGGDVCHNCLQKRVAGGEAHDGIAYELVVDPGQPVGGGWERTKTEGVKVDVCPSVSPQEFDSRGVADHCGHSSVAEHPEAVSVPRP